jgi:cyclopropane-fatty-acyl-phospholipid synthase
MSTLQLVDVERWPGVARTPYSPLRALAARQILRRAVRELPLVVLLPDGDRLGAGGAGAPPATRRAGSTSTSSRGD